MTPELTNITGFVDGPAHGEIFGWAMDESSPDASVLLNVAVSGRPVMTIATFEYRPDVALAYGNQGMNGFRFQLPADMAAEPSIEVSVTSAAGTHLNGSPLCVPASALHASPGQSRRADDPCVLFVHIPRTSGTAFREAIEPNYAGSERLYYYPTPPGIWYERFETLPARQRASFKFMAGHFVFGLHKLIDAHCEYVTLVRDPVARLVSNYWLVVRKKPHEIKSSNGHLLTLEEALERQMLTELDNLTVRCFGGFGERERAAGMIGPEEYETAVENAHRFRFIGHQQSSEAAWNCLRQIFGWEHGSLKRVNEGKPWDHAITEQTRLAIEHYCRYDIEFYKNVLLPRLS